MELSSRAPSFSHKNGRCTTVYVRSSDESGTTDRVGVCSYGFCHNVCWYGFCSLCVMKGDIKEKKT